MTNDSEDAKPFWKSGLLWTILGVVIGAAGVVPAYISLRRESPDFDGSWRCIGFNLPLGEAEISMEVSPAQQEIVGALDQAKSFGRLTFTNVGVKSAENVVIKLAGNGVASVARSDDPKEVKQLQIYKDRIVLGSVPTDETVSVELWHESPIHSDQTVPTVRYDGGTWRAERNEVFSLPPEFIWVMTLSVLSTVFPWVIMFRRELRARRERLTATNSACNPTA